MCIAAIRESTVPIGTAMRNASVSFHAMTASCLAIVSDTLVGGKPLVGYAFDSIGRYAKGGLLRERFLPRLQEAPPEDLLDEQGLIDPARCWAVLMRDEKDGGHGERSGAVGLIDAALWDLRAKQRGVPLWRELAAYYGTPEAVARIPTYGSCGHFQAGGTEALRDEVASARALGYTTVKIKVDGRDVAADLQRIDAAAAALGGAQYLAVDANGKASIEWMREMQACGLAWIEEPASPLDYAALAELAGTGETIIGTGENLFSWDDARNLLRYGGLRAGRDRIQIDMLLAYGLPEYVRMLDGYAAQGWPRSAFWPHAGHLFAAHVVAGLGLGSHEAAPDAGRIYGGFWDGGRVDAGRIDIPELPGVGYEAKANLYVELSALAPEARA